MAPPVHLTFLGGLGEIGRNCAALESEGRIVLLDCWQLCPDDLPGVDAVLPDFTWLLERADRAMYRAKGGTEHTAWADPPPEDADPDRELQLP